MHLKKKKKQLPAPSHSSKFLQESRSLNIVTHSKGRKVMAGYLWMGASSMLLQLNLTITQIIQLYIYYLFMFHFLFSLYRYVKRPKTLMASR